MQAHRRLAVGLFAQRAAVLALHAHRVNSRLGKGRVSEREHPGGRGEALGHQRAVTPPEGLVVPGAGADELLQRLVRIARAGYGGGQAQPGG